LVEDNIVLSKCLRIVTAAELSLCRQSNLQSCPTTLQDEPSESNAPPIAHGMCILKLDTPPQDFLRLLNLPTLLICSSECVPRLRVVPPCTKLCQCRQQTECAVASGKATELRRRELVLGRRNVRCEVVFFGLWFRRCPRCRCRLYLRQRSDCSGYHWLHGDVLGEDVQQDVGETHDGLRVIGKV
jgi:hypothetical protein